MAIRRGPLPLVAAVAWVVAGCGTSLPPPPTDVDTSGAATDYLLGPLDSLQIYVSGVPELSTTLPVRPDGKVSMPLVDDLTAAGKTPSMLARDLEQALEPYVQEPEVSVVVQQFADTSPYTVRVVGAVRNPHSVPYHPQMTVLDALVAVGGLDEFASGNSATLLRMRDGQEEAYSLRLEDLLVDADTSANAPVRPGDVIVVPETLL